MLQTPPAAIAARLDYLDALEAIYDAYTVASREVERAAHGPLCVPHCGLCCERNTVQAYGIEAENAVAHLLGQPRRLKEVKARISAWLTEAGPWTYGERLSVERWAGLQGEFVRAASSRCPFLDDDKRCIIHAARPLACRAYGVTRVASNDCPAVVNGARYWNGHSQSLPLYRGVQMLLQGMTDPKYTQQGFFPTLIYHILDARDLASLIDDGKVPLVKVGVGWGEGYMCLWQEQVERKWVAENADRAIRQQVPLVEEDGQMFQRVGARVPR